MPKGNRGTRRGYTNQSESHSAKGISRGCTLAKHTKCDGLLFRGVADSGAPTFHKCECHCHA